MSENKYCEKCGAVLQENTMFCGNCGATVNSNSFNEDINVINSTTSNNKTKSKTGKVIGSIVSILIILLASSIGKFAGRYMIEDFSTDKHIRDIDAYIESMEDYVPGYYDENHFVSEHFGLEFVVNDQWIMYSEEELEPLSENVRQSAISSGVASMKTEDVSQELIDKWISAVYAETEMGACYVVDDTIMGEVTIGVFSAYGADEATEDEFVEGMKTQLSSMASNVSSGDEIIAGKSYKKLQASVVVDDMDMSNSIFVRIKDGMICMITCKALEGYEDAMLDSFLAQINTYN